MITSSHDRITIICNNCNHKNRVDMAYPIDEIKCEKCETLILELRTTNDKNAEAR